MLTTKNGMVSLSRLAFAAALFAFPWSSRSFAANVVQRVPPSIGQACTVRGAQEIDPYNSIETCLPNGNGLAWYLVGTDGIPHCQSDEVFNYNGSYLTCVKVQIQAPTCLTGQVLTFTGTTLQCIYLATY